MNKVQQLFLREYNFDKELEYLPDVELFNSFDWKTVSDKIPNVSDIKWLKGKESVFLVFDWKPRMNVNIITSERETYVVRSKDKERLIGLNWSGSVNLSLELNTTMTVIIEIKNNNVELNVLSNELDTFPSRIDYTSGMTEEPIKERFSIEYINHIHANSEPTGYLFKGHETDGDDIIWKNLGETVEEISRLSEIPYSDRYLFGAPFCNGNVSTNSPLVFYPSLFLSKMYQVLTNQNFESPLFGMGNYQKCLKTLVNSYLHYIYEVYNSDVVKHIDNITFKDGVSVKHDFSEKCSCFICRAIKRANKLQKKFNFKPPIDPEQYDFGNYMSDEHIKMKYGFEIKSDISTSRFSNMFDINNLITKGVTIFGLGNLGSRIALDLARVPMMNFHLIDGDIIHRENLFTQQYNFDNRGNTKCGITRENIQYIRRAIDRGGMYSYIESYNQYFKPREFSEEELKIRDELGTIHDCLPINVVDFRTVMSTFINSNIIIIAVDNMEDRRNIWNFWKMVGLPTIKFEDDYERPLYIDVSMSHESVRIYSFYFDNVEARKMYETLIGFDATDEGVCGLTSHNYMGTTVSSVVQRIIMDYSVKKELPLYTHVTRDIDTLKYPIADKFDPLYILEITTKIPRECIYMENGLETDLISLRNQDARYSERLMLDRYINGNASHKEKMHIFNKSFHTLILNKFTLKDSGDYREEVKLLSTSTEFYQGLNLTDEFIQFFENGTMCGKTDFCKDMCKYNRFRALCQARNECLGLGDFRGLFDGFWTELLEEFSARRNLYSNLARSSYNYEYSIGDTYFLDTSTITNYRNSVRRLEKDLDKAISTLANTIAEKRFNKETNEEEISEGLRQRRIDQIILELSDL